MVLDTYQKVKYGPLLPKYKTMPCKGKGNKPPKK